MKKYLFVLVLLSLIAFKGKSGGPYTINGPTSVTLNQDAAYSITPADGVDYEWSVTNGTILDGQGTSTIDVQWNIPSGQSGQVECSVDGGGENLVVVWPTTS